MRLRFPVALLLCCAGLPTTAASQESWTLTTAPGCTARSEQVAALPLYDAQARRDLARDPLLLLKPDFSNMPRHLRFDLSACYPLKGMFDAALRVVPVAEYRHILDNGRAQDEQAAWMGQQFDALKRWLRGPPQARADWPMLPFLDMSPQFTLSTRALRFSGGRGIRLVTQFVPDVGFAESGALSYVFQGLSDDDRYFVLLTVPLQVDGGAEDRATQHLGFRLEQIDTDRTAADAYAQRVAALLAEHPPRPSLAQLDALVESLRPIREPRKTAVPAVFRVGEPGAGPDSPPQ